MIRLILLLIIPINLFAQGGLRFIGEKIDFTIDENVFTVNGIYYFSNSSENTIKQNILFPFSQNADSLKVKRVFNLSTFENINFQKTDNAISFQIIVMPKDTAMINIAYSQKTGRENTYILKSTQTWGQALANADYSLTVNTSVQIENLSLKPDTLIKNTYLWNKHNFYPTEDFTIWIK